MATEKISDKINPHTLKTNKLKAFWVLDHLQSSESDRLSCTQIANFLVEKLGIQASQQAIYASLKNTKQATNKSKHGYKLLERGRVELGNHIEKESEQTPKTLIIEPGKPFSAKNESFKKICDSVSGTVYISDPYIDLNTIDILFKHFNGRGALIRLLTNRICEKPIGSFLRTITDARKEGLNIEVGVYENSELHDRYLFDKTVFWLSGNSLNHLGKKESLFVQADMDVRDAMAEAFNRRWTIAQKV